MRFFGLLALTAALFLCLQAQVPPRATPADYQAHAQAGKVTLAAEFTGHSVPTFEGPLTTEDYVAVEAALFGPPGTRLTLSTGDFALRINGRKKPLPSQPYGYVVSSLRDPEWVPPESAEKKSKGSIGASARDVQEGHPPPGPVKIPIPLQRAMAQRVQKAAFPEGDRALPQAGILFFQFRGKTENIESVELIYEGPAGKATLALQPL